MHKLAGVPRGYDWGSTTHIQNLLGLPPDGQPLAELWFGAHPTGPSPLAPATDDAATLEDLIAADAVGTLGGTVAREFAFVSVSRRGAGDGPASSPSSGPRRMPRPGPWGPSASYSR